MKAITKRLRLLRTQHDLSQIETAQRAGMKEYRYCRIEIGYSDPTPEEIKSIARVLKVSPADIDPSFDVSSQVVS